MQIRPRIDWAHGSVTWTRERRTTSVRGPAFDLRAHCERWGSKSNNPRPKRCAKHPGLTSPNTRSAFTLAEVLIALAILSITVAGIVAGYVYSAQRAEWSAFSLAAQSLAMQRVEQVRACKWDPLGWPPVDELVNSNFPPVVDVMDVPIAGTNILYATTYTQIGTVSTSPPLRVIRVDTVWPFQQRGVFTNTIVTYRAPDQ